VGAPNPVIPSAAIEDSDPVGRNLSSLFGGWPRLNVRAGPECPIALLHDNLQKWYPLPVRRQEAGKNPQEWATRQERPAITVLEQAEVLAANWPVT